MCVKKIDDVNKWPQLLNVFKGTNMQFFFKQALNMEFHKFFFLNIVFLQQSVAIMWDWK